jgi:tetratricopeptide (TPR) repeat protein
MAAPATAPVACARWLHGPLSDLALGCGGLYALAFAAYAANGPAFERVFPVGLLPLGALVLGTPHYGATLLRVYQRSADRRAYRVFALHATLAIALLFVLGVYDVGVGSLLLTVYLSWSPWHYSSQNYGIALLFLGRRGVALGRFDKRLLHASFLLSWLLVLVAVHVEDPQGAYAPVELGGIAYRALPLGIPAPVAAHLLIGLALAYLVALVACVRLLRQRAAWRELAPTLALLALQALWFSLPVLSRSTLILTDLAPLDPYRQADTFHWIAFGHFLQYLWITSYYARAAGSETGRTRYLLRAFLAGSLVWGIPSLVFAPGALGVRAFDAGLAALVASAVNIHHFVLDGAIWKLRDGSVARVLIRRGPESGGEPFAPARRRIPGLGLLAWGAGAVYLAINAVGILEVEYGFRRAAIERDVGRLRVAARRLALVGRDHPGLRAQLALFAEHAGDLETGLREIRRSLELHPTAGAFVILGRLEERSGNRERALVAYREALALDPGNAEARRGAGAGSPSRGVE